MCFWMGLMTLRLYAAFGGIVYISLSTLDCGWFLCTAGDLWLPWVHYWFQELFCGPFGISSVQGHGRA